MFLTGLGLGGGFTVALGCGRILAWAAAGAGRQLGRWWQAD